MSYGEPRATLDVDVVIALKAADLDAIRELFPAPDFYLSLDAAQEALRSETQFNVIHPASGMKDFFVAGDPIERSQLDRRLRRAILPGVEAWCSPPEELIVKKLSYYAMGSSDKHLRDIAAMLRISSEQIDLATVRRLASDSSSGSKLLDLLDQVVEQAG